MSEKLAFCPSEIKEIKTRIMKFAESINQSLEGFSANVFGSDAHFKGDRQVTLTDLIVILGKYPEVNMNWVLCGKGKKLCLNAELLVDLLEEELNEMQNKYETLDSSL